VILIEHLDFQYPKGEFSLGISGLSIEDGTTVAVIGESGTGKTTFLNLIAGISAPTSGTVEVNGIKVSELDDAVRRDFRIRNIGLVFQEFELLEYLTVLDNILLPFRVHASH